jgi:hypothetical protein
VNGISAALTGRPPGWTTLAWTMADGTRTRLSAYGVERDDLLRFAEGLRTDPAEPRYTATVLPPGFVESAVEVGGRSDDAGYVARAQYSLAGQGLRVGVDVYSEPLPSGTSPLDELLASADAVEPVSMLGETGLLVHYPDGRWTIAAQMGSCLVNVRIDGGATRVQVDALLAALHVADDAEWAALLATRPPPAR